MSGIINMLKGHFLISKGSSKNWRFIIYASFLGFLMITTAHSADKKVYIISKLNEEVRVLRSEFVDTRSKLQRMRLKSVLIERLKPKGIGFPDKSLKRVVVQVKMK